MLISTTAMLYKLINCYVLRHSSGSCSNNLSIETLQIAGFKEIMIQVSLWNAQRYLQWLYSLWLSMFVMIGNGCCVLSVIERYKGESTYSHSLDVSKRYDNHRNMSVDQYTSLSTLVGDTTIIGICRPSSNSSPMHSESSELTFRSS